MALLASACAPGFEPPRAPTAAEIPSLEAHLEHEPESVPALVRLGVAYREANRLTDARDVLARATSLQPSDPAAVFYLGLTYEDLDLPVQARELYEGFFGLGGSPELAARLRNRLPLLERQELRLAVRSAIEREAELATTPPEPGTVAVFPFLFLGQDTELRPLGRALTEMLVTDLSQTNRVRVLLRSGVQMLLDELALGESGLVDPSTAVRGGRLLRAENIVQGQLGGDERLLRLEAAVVGSMGGGGGRRVTDEDALRQFFTMQKRLSLSLYRSLGIELTAAERERVMQQPTESLEALLAYGECLEAEDAGNFELAAIHCQRAAMHDPGFTAARDRAQRATAIAAAMEESTEELAQLGALEGWPAVTAARPTAAPGTTAATPGQPTQPPTQMGATPGQTPTPTQTTTPGQTSTPAQAAASGRPASTPAVELIQQALDAIQVLVPDPSIRAPVAEATGAQGIGRGAAVIEIIIPRP